MAYQDVVLTDGPLMYHRFEGLDPEADLPIVVPDVTGNGHDGNIPIIGGAKPTNTGRVGGGLSVPGFTYQGYCFAHDRLVAETAGDFSVEFWCRPLEALNRLMSTAGLAARQDRALYFPAYNENPTGIGFALGTNGIVGVFSSNGVIDPELVYHSADGIVGWNHITMTVNLRVASFYVNAAFVGSITNPVAENLCMSTGWGRQIAAFNNYNEFNAPWRGELDEIAHYDYQLSVAQMEAHIAAAGQGLAKPVVGVINIGETSADLVVQ